MALSVRDRCVVCCRRMAQCATWSLAREIPVEVMASSPTSVNVDTFTFSKCLSPVHFGFWIDAKRNLLEIVMCVASEAATGNVLCRVKHFQMRMSRTESGARLKELHLWRLAQCHG